MIKFYRRLPTSSLAYHEAWIDGDEIVEHWGIVGSRGEMRTHQLDGAVDEKANLDRILAKLLSEGFAPIDFENHAVLLIEYAVDGFGTKLDLEKRYALQDRMDQILGWTGLGHCDGGSIGSGTMEVFYFVVNFDIAKRVIERDLRATEFDDYARICDESTE